MITIPVLYSCKGCGLVKRPVQVAARLSDQDVLDWMDRELRVALSRDHARVSPDCESPTIEEIMIPMTGCDVVGGPTLQ